MTTDLYATLRDADPAARLARYDDAELSAMAHAIADGAGSEPSVLPAPRRRVRRRLVIAVPIAAAAAAALVIAPALTSSPSASADAASVLNQAADNITVVDPTARPGQWWQVSTTGTNLVDVNTSSGGVARQVALLEARTRTDFFAVDGSRPTISVSGPASLVRQLSGDRLTADELAAWVDGSTRTWTSDGAPNDTPGTWQSPTPAFLAALPRDTSDLRQRLYRDSASSGSSRDGEAFVYVVDLLRSGMAPADLRSALYRVLATVGGVEVTSRTAAVGTDTGVGFGRAESANGSRQEIVIDPTTGNLLGEREVTTAPMRGIPVGTAITEVRTTRTLVDSVPADVLDRAQPGDCAVTKSVACSR